MIDQHNRGESTARQVDNLDTRLDRIDHSPSPDRQIEASLVLANQVLSIGVTVGESHLTALREIDRLRKDGYEFVHQIGPLLAVFPNHVPGVPETLSYYLPTGGNGLVPTDDFSENQTPGIDIKLGWSPSDYYSPLPSTVQFRDQQQDYLYTQAARVESGYLEPTISIVRSLGFNAIGVRIAGDPPEPTLECVYTEWKRRDDHLVGTVHPNRHPGIQLLDSRAKELFEDSRKANMPRLSSEDLMTMSNLLADALAGVLPGCSAPGKVEILEASARPHPPRPDLGEFVAIYRIDPDLVTGASKYFGEFGINTVGVITESEGYLTFRKLPVLHFGSAERN